MMQSVVSNGEMHHLGTKEGSLLGERAGSSDKFKRVGIEGPKISVSRIPLR